MGRLVPVKGFDMLLSSFAPLVTEFPDWDLTILGNGSLMGELKAQAAKLGIENRVNLPGFVNPPFEYLKGADLFAFTSHSEGFGLALMEAMACGLPAVSFDCPSGPGEIIRHEVDGLLVPPMNIEALRENLRRLMNNEEERKQMGERAKEVLQRFAPSEIMKKWERVIHEAIGAVNM